MLAGENGDSKSLFVCLPHAVLIHHYDICFHYSTARLSNNIGQTIDDGDTVGDHGISPSLTGAES